MIYNSCWTPWKRRIPLRKRYLWTRPYSRNFWSHCVEGVWEGKMLSRNFLAKNLNRVHNTGYDFNKRSYYV